MSDTPDRSIKGLAPRAGAPDFSRLQRRNRITTDAPAPAPVVAVPVTEASAPPAPAPAIPEPGPPATASAERERVTTYLDGQLRARAREAYRATSHLEGDKSWSDFVERAILAEVERREVAHNNGDVYAGDTTRLSPGRPLK
jgi:hypothetical protein